MNQALDASEEYDIVIIGAGTAGSVIAHCLSTQTHLSVLVLEAGENRNDDPNVYTPGLVRRLLDNADYDWQFKTEPEAGLNGRSIKHPRGKVVGGTSATNSLALLYPNRASIDAWEAMGNDGWNWETLRPYFEKFQTIGKPAVEVRDQLPLAHSEKAVERTQGPLKTSFPPRVTLVQTVWVESWRALGLGDMTDAFDGNAVGGHTSVCHISSERKERSHAGEAFLASAAANRENLKVLTGASVRRIVFSQDVTPLRAKGVEYSKDDKRYAVHARKKVILAAGSILSPAILEHSGIGDKERLSDLGITLTYHNPAVGENLQDHIRGALMLEEAESVPGRNTLPESEVRERYETNRSGPWAESACWAFAYMPLPPFIEAGEQADCEAKLSAGLSVNFGHSNFEKKHREYLKGVLSSPQEVAATAFLTRRAYAPVEPGSAKSGDTNWIGMCAMLSHPLSRGTVHIVSREPDEHPEIKCNYYSNELDLDVHAHIMKGLQRLAGTEPFKSIIKPGGRREPPLTPDSPLEDYKAALRAYAGTNYHPVGTCSMLPEGDGGVVDSRLKVYGTENLHVIDASIMPVIPRANVITAVYAVAERAADLLLEGLGLTSNGQKSAAQ